MDSYSICDLLCLAFSNEHNEFEIFVLCIFDFFTWYLFLPTFWFQLKEKYLEVISKGGNLHKM